MAVSMHMRVDGYNGRPDRRRLRAGRSTAVLSLSRDRSVGSGWSSQLDASVIRYQGERDERRELLADLELLAELNRGLHTG
jgi:hypothetical protein